ncbi:MAG: coiled-coil domain-containing protein [Flavobacterium sp.]|uniref:coiled-coil domain-containing protein n=1 Tax=Flavobacterium sp. TaxID=239 RepID=UPI003BC69D91
MFYFKLKKYHFTLLIFLIICNYNVYGQINYDSLYRIEYKNKKDLESQINQLYKSLNELNNIFKSNSKQEDQNKKEISSIENEIKQYDLVQNEKLNLLNAQIVSLENFKNSITASDPIINLKNQFGDLKKYKTQLYKQISDQQKELIKLNNDLSQLTDITQKPVIERFEKDSKALNDYIVKINAQILTDIRKILLTDSFDVARKNTLAALKMRLPNNQSLIDSINRFSKVVDYIDEVRSFLNQDYDKANHVNIKNKYSEIQKNPVLFNTKQNEKIDDYNYFLDYYCSIYSENSRNWNSLIIKVIDSDFNELDRLNLENYFKDNTFDDDYSYLKKQKINILSAINNRNVSQLKGLQLRTLNCSNNAN